MRLDAYDFDEYLGRIEEALGEVNKRLSHRSKRLQMDVVGVMATLYVGHCLRYAADKRATDD